MSAPWWLPQHRELRTLAGEHPLAQQEPVAILDGCPACLVPQLGGTWGLYRPVGSEKLPEGLAYRYQSLGLQKYPHAVERFSDAPAVLVKQPRSTADVLLAEPIARIYLLALPWLRESPTGIPAFLRWLFYKADRPTLERVWSVTRIASGGSADDEAAGREVGRETLAALSPLRRPSSIAP